MSRKASNFQKVVMSWVYRGKEIFKPLNTGWIDDHVACVREWIANIFFYTKNGTTIMIDAGYNYERLNEKMKWLDIDPSEIKDILITHQDTDHVGAVERDSDGLFRNAKLYISKIENQYMTGEKRRKVIFGLYKLPMVKSDNERVLLKDGDVFTIGDIKVEAILVPGHTWGHMVYLIDNEYLFTGDTIWFGADGGYSFINALAEDNDLSKRSLAKLEDILRSRNICPKVITGHTGWSDDLDFVFAHKDQVCNSMKKQKPHDPNAPYDGYDEREDTEFGARNVRLVKVVSVTEEEHTMKPDYKNWVPKGMVYGLVAGTGVLTAAFAVSLAVLKKASTPVRVGTGIVLGLGALGCGKFAQWSIMAYRQFSYDGKRQLSKQIIEGTAEYVKLPEGGKGLDVGCGSGALTIACAKRNPQGSFIGIDRWGKEYASFSKTLCKSNASAEGVSNTEFRQGDATKLDFPDETFDAVTSNYVYHNIPVNKQDLLRETLRVLKKGGTFAIHDIMSKGRYGDMKEFVKELLDAGYEEVKLIPTDDGMFMTKREAVKMMLKGSCLLVGKK